MEKIIRRVMVLITGACLLLGGSTAFAAQTSYYPLDGNANDLSGNGNNGTLVNGPTYTTGKYGEAVSFDGIDDMVTTTSSVTSPSTVSIALWFKTSSPSGHKIVGLDNGPGAYDYNLYIGTDGKLRFGIWDSVTAANVVASTSTVTDGAWHHAAVTYQTKAMTLYLDGVLQETLSIPNGPNAFTGKWLIGGNQLNSWPNGSNGYYNGLIDDVRIYNYALSVTEINQIKTGLQVAAGILHAFAQKPDGTLWAWGRGSEGQLGDGTQTNRTTPGLTGSETTWVAIAGGNYHTLGVKSDGTLWAWGANGNGQLGDNTTTLSNVPKQIGSDTTWTAVSARGNFSLGLKSNGTIWAWGVNTNGQLGDNTTTESHIPQQVGTDTNWTAISAGSSYSIALKSNGTLWAWGINAFGQLGDNTTTESHMPKQIGSDTTWIAVSGGGNTTMALKSDGTLWGWGRNWEYQLGDGTTTNSLIPKQIGTDTNWTAVSLTNSATIALKSNGTIWTWGTSANGEVGDGTTTTRTTPGQVGSNTNWAAISAGGWFTAALQSDGTVWTWGHNGAGQIGDGTTTNSLSPKEVNFPPVITSNGGGATASISVAENQTAVTTATANEYDGESVTYSITGGSDSAQFSINSSTGELTFVSAPNFEVPTDSDANNTYEVIVQASDGSLTDSQTITVTVTNVNDVAPSITSNGGGATASVNAAENQTAVTAVTASDADGPTTTYSITGGSDSDKFTINSSTGVLTFISTPNYESPTDSDANNTYIVTVQASDGSLPDSQAITVTVTDVDDTPPATTATPPAGSYSSAQNVALNCNDGSGSGCGNIYYTTDGTTPDIFSAVYAGPINISANTTIKYFAVDLLGNGELTKTSTYTMLTGGVDLMVSSISAPGSAAIGQNISVSNTAENMGSVTSKSFYIYFYLSSNTTYEASDTYIGYRSVGYIAGGVSSSATNTLTIPAYFASTGTYYIIAVADSTNTNAESNEGNNTAASGAINIVNTNIDLTVTTLTAPESATIGMSLALPNTLSNLGSTASRSSNIYFYLSSDTAHDTSDIYIGYRSIGSVVGSGISNATTTLTIPANLASTGTYYIIAVADANNSNVESNEGNNKTASGAINIVSGRDLAITSISAPASAGKGQGIAVSNTLSNQGSVATISSNTYFYLSTDTTYSSSDIYIGYRSVGIISAEGSSSASTTVTIPANLSSAGTYYIIAVADATNRNAESNEGNNTAASEGINITVP